MSNLKRSAYSIFILLSCCFLLFPTKLYAYTWDRGKSKKYTEYSLALDSGYNMEFDYQDDERNQTVYFKDETKKLIFSLYKERELSDRFTYISKLNVHRIMSKLDVNVVEGNGTEGGKEESEEKNNNWNQLDSEASEFIDYTTENSTEIEKPEQIPLKDFKANMSFIGVEYEIGLRTLLNKTQSQRISLDAIVGLPPAVHGEGGGSIFHPSFKLGLSYAKTFDFLDMKGNFFELTAATKIHPKIRNKEMFFTAMLGFKVSAKTSLTFAFENNYLYKNSFERYVFTNIYKKVTTRKLSEELKLDLKSHIDSQSLLNEKKIERKIQTRIGYQINNKNELCFDYVYKFGKEKSSQIIKISLVKLL